MSCLLFGLNLQIVGLETSRQAYWVIFIWLTETNISDNAIEEEWQMACEELAKEDSNEGEDKSPPMWWANMFISWQGKWNYVYAMFWVDL